MNKMLDLLQQRAITDYELDVLERPSSEFLDSIIGKKFAVLDKGYITVRDYMGDWRNIARTARMSYSHVDIASKTEDEDKSLIFRLLRDVHTSPFESNEIRFEIRVPIFVARQWFRHRTANYNEESARYSVLEDVMYLPELDWLMPQSKNNKQGRSGSLTDEQKKEIADIILNQNESSYEAYDLLIDKYNLTRELARTVLNINTYTRFSFKMDLHNLLHFIFLRTDKHAQKEIRDCACVIEAIVSQWVPPVYEAFVEYKKNAFNVGYTVFSAIMASIEDKSAMFQNIANSGISKSEYLGVLNKVFELSPPETFTKDEKNEYKGYYSSGK